MSSKFMDAFFSLAREFAGRNNGVNGHGKKNGNGNGHAHLAVPTNGNGRHSALTGVLQGEEWFTRMLCLERKRSERSRKPFLFAVLDVEPLLERPDGPAAFTKLVTTLTSSLRETDQLGWYKVGAAVGLLLTEFSTEDRAAIMRGVESRVQAAVEQALAGTGVTGITVSYHFFPEERASGPGDSNNVVRFYPDVADREDSQQLNRLLKRAVDIVGSSLALAVSAPLLLLIAVLIKLTSKGPVLYKQKRVGRYGVPFTFLKFRTMHAAADSDLHREFVSRFIAGRIETRGPHRFYKITNDPRVTRIGRFLRKTSLDEFPQFWNVLCGDMSLVGPRPPTLYELDAYDIWHRRRVLEVEPGITGLWQVAGRSRTSFDEMVRLDLRYARTWSVWLDLKILLQTPRAVLSGEGAS
jgi:lipopolysaccharide/colanic/teichoic acid biosynthesis glycosyltransferase